ncbi:MAG: S-layer homology domain-containing protein [Clostridiales bacterium]|nr:S-layer homology domain-containing protein [Clostridiales bacterium]
MKNFKKVLALVLALATLLSFATVAGAKVDTTEIYADAKDVKYVEAVDVLTAIGVLNGKGASYKPNDTLKRSEAAKIIAMFDNGDTDISKLYNPANTFVDVAKDYWAVSYIAYCAKQGIISGVGNNKYAPESKLTGIQFLKMVLVTLGYDAKEEGLVGTSWKVNVLKLARAAGLTDVLGKKYDYDAELTRDAAAQIMLNALNAKTVSYGQEIKTSGRKNVLTTAGAIENDSYLYESWDLKKLTDKDDAFGRPCHIWKLGKDEIGTYVEGALASYTVAVAGCDILNDCDFDEDGVKLTSYEDGVKAGTKMTIKNTTATDIGGQGVLTEVFEDRIVFINTYLAKVTKVVTEKRDAKDHVTRKAATTLSVWNNGTQFTAAGTTATKTFESDAFAKDDMVLVTVANGDVQTVAVAESKIAEFTKIKKVDGKFAQIALDGEFSDIAAKYFYNGIDAADLGNDMVAYFDAYGNVIGMEKYYAPLNYAVIDALWVESIKGKATVKADLVTVAGDKLEDVEITSVTVNADFFNGATTGADTEFKATDLIALGTSALNVVFANNTTLAKLYDTLFAYTTTDGAYKLSLNGKGIWDNTVYNAVLTADDAEFTNGSSYVKKSGVLFQMTTDTLILVQDAGTSAPFATYTAYVGYDKVPSMTGDVQYHVNKDTNKVDVVYVNDISVSGTKTVIFFAGADRFAGKKVDGKYPIEFDAYALDKAAGTLTKATYTFKSANKDALKNMAVGFYEVYVSDSNEISLVVDKAPAGTTAPDGLITVEDLLTGTNIAQGVAATGKADVTGNYIVATPVAIDGGDADVVTYALDGDALKDANFADLANGDKLYVYKSDDKFTVVNAASLAAYKAVDTAGATVLGVVASADQTIGHTWEGTTFSNLPEGMHVNRVLFGSTVFTAASQWEADQTYVVTTDVTVELAWDAAYTTTAFKDPIAGLGATTANTITVTGKTYNYTAKELLKVLEAGLEANSAATIELKFGADFVDVNDTDLRFVTKGSDANVDSWTVVVTPGNGGTAAVYTFVN